MLRRPAWPNSSAMLMSMGLLTSFAAVPAAAIAGALSCDDSLKNQFAIEQRAFINALYFMSFEIDA
jgi:hypothetical protein